MLLILSGAYVSPEFQAEVGKVPPAFLPVGNRRLFQWQVEFLRQYAGEAEHIILTVPSDFSVPEFEERWLDRNRVTLVKSPAGMGLSQALGHVLTQIAPEQPEELTLLLGDTLVTKWPFQAGDREVVVTAEMPEYYPSWTLRNQSNGLNAKEVWCGLFRIGSIRRLQQVLDVSDDRDFPFVMAKYFMKNGVSEVQHRSLEEGEWLDFGHLNTYFQSRAKITTQRSFNSLSIKDGVVSKSSQDTEKMLRESQWFKELPRELKVFAPQLVQEATSSNGGYELEYLPFLPLNEVFVHLPQSEMYWERVIQQLSGFSLATRHYCEEWSATRKHQVVHSLVKSLYTDKTTTRIEQFEVEALKTGKSDFIGRIEVNGGNAYSMRSLASKCIPLVEEASDVDLGYAHGDLCFSNILYDTRSARIKVLDPKGSDPRLYGAGDRNYDLAKLLHSVCGYDDIIAGKFQLEWNTPANPKHPIQAKLSIRTGESHPNARIVWDQLWKVIPKLTKRSKPELMARVVLLFVSMIPLHADRPERQRAFLCNAIRLYERFLAKGCVGDL